ncbi:hypothetical protein J6590_001119 [Homalodisca vitripennis]|nr:hypothetical protein J6590_001119 [Homalodisca vitripennis]
MMSSVLLGRVVPQSDMVSGLSRAALGLHPYEGGVQGCILSLKIAHLLYHFRSGQAKLQRMITISAKTAEKEYRYGNGKITVTLPVQVRGARYGGYCRNSPDLPC